MRTNKRFRKHHTFKLHGHTLESVGSAKYRVVALSEDPSWTPHVDNIAVKASKTPTFLRRNMFHCTDRVRERTYNVLVLPVLNYATAGKNSCLARDINSLDGLQRMGSLICLQQLLRQNPCLRDWYDTGSCMAVFSGEKRRPHTDAHVQTTEHPHCIGPKPILKGGDSRTRGRSRLQQSAATSTACNNSFYP